MVSTSSPSALRREHRARLDRLAVHMDGARSARGSVAADVGARETSLVAYVMHQERSRLHIVAMLLAVDFD